MPRAASSLASAARCSAVVGGAGRHACRGAGMDGWLTSSGCWLARDEADDADDADDEEDAAALLLVPAPEDGPAFY